jgi:hypothetical protein
MQVAMETEHRKKEGVSLNKHRMTTVGKEKRRKRKDKTPILTEVGENDIVACRTVAMQQPQDGRIYQTRSWATAR